jgi:hypothetical protein
MCENFNECGDAMTISRVSESKHGMKLQICNRYQIQMRGFLDIPRHEIDTMQAAA